MKRDAILPSSCRPPTACWNLFSTRAAEVRKAQACFHAARTGRGTRGRRPLVLQGPVARTGHRLGYNHGLPPPPVVLGAGLAEAMDTAQRGMGMDWTNSLELVRRTLDAAKDVPGAVVASGAGTDHLAPDPNLKLEQIIAAYEEQCSAIEKLGGRIILMAAGRWLHRQVAR